MSGERENMAWERMLKEIQDGSHASEIPQLPPENITTQQLFMLLVAQNAKIATLTTVVSEIAVGQKDIVETWRTAGNILRFIKVVGAFGTAIAAIWAGIKVLAHMIRHGS